MAFAFDEVGVNRLEARAMAANERGNGALRKVGARKEAVLRQSMAKGGRLHDEHLWAIVETDWRQANGLWQPADDRMHPAAAPVRAVGRREGFTRPLTQLPAVEPASSGREALQMVPARGRRGWGDRGGLFFFYRIFTQHLTSLTSAAGAACRLTLTDARARRLEEEMTW